MLRFAMQMDIYFTENPYISVSIKKDKSFNMGSIFWEACYKRNTGTNLRPR